MAAWLPILKTVLPYLTTIVTAAVPAFTARKDNGKSAEVTAQQIAELQDAVRKNAESVRVLAEQMQRTIEAIETAALSNERTIRKVRWSSAAALVIAVLALGAALLVAWAG